MKEGSAFPQGDRSQATVIAHEVTHSWMGAKTTKRCETAPFPFPPTLLSLRSSSCLSRACLGKISFPQDRKGLNKKACLFGRSFCRQPGLAGDLGSLLAERGLDTLCRGTQTASFLAFPLYIMLVASLSWHIDQVHSQEDSKKTQPFLDVQTKIMERHEGKPIAHLKVSLAHKHTGASKALCCIAFQ